MATKTYLIRRLAPVPRQETSTQGRFLTFRNTDPGRPGGQMLHSRFQLLPLVAPLHGCGSHISTERRNLIHNDTRTVLLGQHRLQSRLRKNSTPFEPKPNTPQRRAIHCGTTLPSLREQHVINHRPNQTLTPHASYKMARVVTHEMLHPLPHGDLQRAQFIQVTDTHGKIQRERSHEAADTHELRRVRVSTWPTVHEMLQQFPRRRFFLLQRLAALLRTTQLRLTTITHPSGHHSQL